MKIDESICNDLINSIKNRENVLIVVPPLINVDIEVCFKNGGIKIVQPENLRYIKGWGFWENLWGVRKVILIKELREDFIGLMLYSRQKQIPIVCILRMGNQIKDMATILGRHRLSKWDVFDRILEIKLNQKPLISQEIQEKYSYLSNDQRLILKNIYMLTVAGIIPNVEKISKITGFERKVVEDALSVCEFLEFIRLKDGKILSNMDVLEYLFGSEDLNEDYIRKIYKNIEDEDMVKLANYIYNHEINPLLGLEILENALQNITVMNNPKLYADIKYYQAKIYIKLLSLSGGNPSKVIACAKESAEIRKKLGDEIGYIDSLNLMGVGYLNASFFNNSLENLKNAEKTFMYMLNAVTDKYPLETAITSVNLGITYMRLAETLDDSTYALKGEYHLKEAIKIFKSLNLKDRLLNALVNLGAIYETLGSILKSDKYYMESISVYNLAKDLAKNREEYIISSIDNNIALALMGLAKLKRDIRHLQESEKILINSPIPKDASLLIIRKYRNLAIIYQSMYELSRDKNYLYKSAEYFEKIIMDRDVINRPAYFCSVALDLSDVYERLGMFDKIKSLMKRVINVAKRNNLEHYKKQAEEILEKFKGF